MARIQFEGLNDFSAVSAVGPAAPYMGASGSSGEEDTSKSSKKGSIGGLDENMIKWLYQKGLSSDVAAFMELMEFAITNAIDPVTGKANVAMYKMLLPLLSRIALEKEQFDKAMDSVRNNNALDEIAVSARGEVYVVGEDGTISLEDPSDVYDERVLTNGELAKMRATDPYNGAFKFDLTSTIANGTSMTKIYDYLKDTLTGLSSNTVKSEQFADSNGNVVLGAKAILAMMLGQGGLKITTETTNSKALIQEAFNYIIKSLPKNMQAVLLVRANKSNTTIEDTLSNILHSKTGVSVKTSIDYVDGFAAKTARELEKKDKEHEIKLKPFSLYTLSHGGAQLDVRINPASNINVTLPGRTFSKLVSSDNKEVPDGSLDTILNSGIGRLVSASNGVYVGNKRVDTTDFDEILIETGAVKRVYLPSTIDGNSVEHPVFELVDQLSKYEQVRSKLPSINKQVLYEILKDDRFKLLRLYVDGFDNNFEIIWKNATFKPYLLMNAATYAQDTYFGGTFGGNAPIKDTKGFDDWATPADIAGSDEKQLAEKMERILKNNRKDGKLYRALVYLPMSADAIQQNFAAEGILTYELDRKTPSKPTDIRNTEKKASKGNPGDVNSSIL